MFTRIKLKKKKTARSVLGKGVKQVKGSSSFSFEVPLSLPLLPCPVFSWWPKPSTQVMLEPLTLHLKNLLPRGSF